MREITEQIRESQDAAEAIQSSVPHKAWVLEGIDGNGQARQIEYTQAELSFFEKQQFMTLLTEFVDKFISGELGISLQQLFEGDLRKRVQIPTEFTGEQAENLLNENAGIIQAIIKVVNALPNLQQEIFLLALGVPRNEREFARQIMIGPVHRGGLTDDQGFEILKTFMTQNAKAIRTFFEERGADLVAHFRREVLEETVDSTVEEEETKTSLDEGTPGGMPLSTSSPAIPVTP